jgi:glycosyltransferase involved in cell wall biosynthesis
LNKIELAFVIPFFKITFFEETIKSIANQTDKRFKVFIGDDASPEDCVHLLKEYENKFDYKYHRFPTNIGGSNLTKQWERCLDLIEDENINWIMILGDDDFLAISSKELVLFSTAT